MAPKKPVKPIKSVPKTPMDIKFPGKGKMPAKKGC